MTWPRPWKSSLTRKPSPCFIGKVFKLAYADADGHVVDKYQWPYAVWDGTHFTGIGETPDDPRTHDGVVYESMNYPDNFWRPVT